MTIKGDSACHRETGKDYCWWTGLFSTSTIGSVTAKCSDPVIAIQAHNCTPLSQCMTAVKCACFCQLLCCALLQDTFTLVFPHVFWIFLVQFYTANLYCHILFRQKRLSSGKPFKQAVFFLIAFSWSLRFNMLTQACSLWDAVIGIFRISLTITRSDLGVNLLRCSLTGR